MSRRTESARCRKRIGLLVIAICLAGCSSARYRAADLPDEMRTPPADDPAEVNLTKLSAGTGSDAQIGPGDVLELTLATGYETGRIDTLVVRVSPAGTIRVPLIGEVAVAGLEPAEAEQTIATLAVQRGVFRSPFVTVDIKRPHTIRVTVVGAVDDPGTHELQRSSRDLLGALAAAGGLTDDAGLEIEVVRKSPQPPTVGVALASHESPVGRENLRINLARLSDELPQTEIGDGDVVMVFPQKPRVVHVMGLVEKPGQYDIPPGKDMHVLDSLAIAGGRTLQAADKVHVIRRVADSNEPLVIEVSVDEAKKNGRANLRLAPGDLVSVEETALTATLDMLKNFVRFGISSSVPLF